MQARNKFQIGNVGVLLAVVTLGSSCLFMHGEKKWRISQSDVKRFSGEFVRYSISIANEVCQKDEEDNFLPVSFERVPIPPLLLEHFTESALERYFEKTDTDRMRAWMIDLTEAGEWTPTILAKREVGSRRVVSRDEGPALQIKLHNTSPLRIQQISVHLVGTDHDFDLLPPRPVEPGKEGVFVVGLSKNMYDMMRQNKFKVVLTRVTWRRP